MNSVSEIKRAIAHLSKDDLARLRRWFEEFDVRAWDEQFERDVESGSLDQIAEKVAADYRAGKSTEL